MPNNAPNFANVLNRMIKELERNMRTEETYQKSYKDKYTAPPSATLWYMPSRKVVMLYEQSKKNLNRLRNARNSLIKAKQAGPRTSARNMFAEFYSPWREKKRGTFNVKN